MDVMPDYDLERARVELEISQLELNIKSMEYRKMQIHSELAQNQHNIDATKAAIEEKRKEVTQIVAPEATN